MTETQKLETGLMTAGNHSTTMTSSCSGKRIGLVVVILSILIVVGIVGIALSTFYWNEEESTVASVSYKPAVQLASCLC